MINMKFYQFERELNPKDDSLFEIKNDKLQII